MVRKGKEKVHLLVINMNVTAIKSICNSTIPNRIAHFVDALESMVDGYD